MSEKTTRLKILVGEAAVVRSAALTGDYPQRQAEPGVIAPTWNGKKPIIIEPTDKPWLFAPRSEFEKLKAEGLIRDAAWQKAREDAEDKEERTRERHKLPDYPLCRKVLPAGYFLYRDPPRGAFEEALEAALKHHADLFYLSPKAARDKSKGQELKPWWSKAVWRQSYHYTHKVESDGFEWDYGAEKYIRPGREHSLDEANKYIYHPHAIVGPDLVEYLPTGDLGGHDVASFRQRDQWSKEWIAANGNAADARLNQERVAKPEMEYGWWDDGIGKPVAPYQPYKPVSDTFREELDKEFRKNHRPPRIGTNTNPIKIQIDRNRAEDPEDWEQIYYLEKCEKQQVKSSSFEALGGQITPKPEEIHQHLVGSETLLVETYNIAGIKEWTEDNGNENEKAVLKWIVDNGLMAGDAFDHAEFASVNGITEERSWKWLSRYRARLEEAAERLDLAAYVRSPSRSPGNPRYAYLSELPAAKDVVSTRLEFSHGRVSGKSKPSDARLYLETVNGTGLIRHQGEKAILRALTKAAVGPYGGLPGVSEYLPEGRDFPQPIEDESGQPVPNELHTLFFQRVFGNERWDRGLTLEYTAKGPFDRNSARTLIALIGDNILGRIVDVDRYSEVEAMVLLDTLIFYRLIAVDSGMKAAREIPLTIPLELLIAIKRRSNGCQNLPALMDKPIKLSANLGLLEPNWTTYRYGET